MSFDDRVGTGARILLRAAECKGGLFCVLFVWMFSLGLPRHVVITYAALFAAWKAGMQTKLKRIAQLAGKSERQIQRDLDVIEARGLAQALPRMRGGKRSWNGYALFWAPSMPPEMRCGPDVDVTVPPDAAVTDEQDTGGGIHKTLMSRLKSSGKNRLKQQTSTAVDVADVELPVELVTALESAAPGHTQDALCVLRRLTASMPPLDARLVTIASLRKLITCCQRGGVDNPPGLLRSTIAPSVVKDAAKLRLQFDAALRKRDDAWMKVRDARSGFAFLQALRAFQKADGPDAQTALPLPPLTDALPPLPAELVAAVVKARELIRMQQLARHRDDGVAVSELGDKLHKLQFSLDDFFQTQKGAAE